MTTRENEALVHIIQAVSHLSERVTTITGTNSAKWIHEELLSAWALLDHEEEKETT